MLYNIYLNFVSFGQYLPNAYCSILKCINLIVLKFDM